MSLRLSRKTFINARMKNDEINWKRQRSTRPCAYVFHLTTSERQALAFTSLWSLNPTYAQECRSFFDDEHRGHGENPPRRAVVQIGSQFVFWCSIDEISGANGIRLFSFTAPQETGSHPSDSATDDTRVKTAVAYCLAHLISSAPVWNVN